ncbi:MAG TPA: linear amide C-N hydrolase [Gammaproteobacteria bacterium]|jgi:choloylglycine hydrolase|nr:linear amide C-N hydrolase [Gammaproteobacteria bacterium]
MNRIFLSSIFAFSFLSNSVFSCTTIFWNNNPQAKVVARSVDLFMSDTPLIKTQPRGLKHDGDTGENSLTWQSKYGSVIVTAFHANAITDGINEKGLAAHLLYLSGTEYPVNKNKLPEISNLMWSQYILDNFATVNEALAGSKDLQIVAKKVKGQIWPIHLTIEDASGDSAIIEFIKGKMHVYHGSQYRVMTNEPAFNIQLANLKKYQSFGGKLPLPGDPDPLSRFVRAATFLKTLPEPKSDLEAIAGVLAVMRTAMVPFGAQDTSGNKTEDAWATRWVSVADVTNKIYYFNSTSAPNIIWVDLNKVDFTENSPVLSIDPTDIKLKGDITKQLI